MSTEKETLAYRQAFEAGALQERERLAWRQQVLEAEADVCSGRACAREQEKGKGPCGACVRCLQARIKHLEASLRHISETCIEDPEVAHFALRAAENPPTAFPPEEP